MRQSPFLLCLCQRLTPLSDYRLEIFAGIGSYLSEPTVSKISTSEICFFEMTPELLQPANITSSGFTLGWNPLTGAEEYAVTVAEKSYGDTEYSTCDFSEWPAQWTSSSSKLNKAMFGKSSPALQLSDDGDYIEFDSNGKRIDTLSLWVRSQSSSNSMRIEYRDEVSDEWQTLAEEDLATQGQDFSYNMPDASIVRLTLLKGSGYIVVDDMQCGYSPIEWMAMDGYTNIRVGSECLLEVSGLDPETTYRVAVTGFDGTEYSRTSAAMVTTADGSGVDTIDSHTEAYPLGRYTLTGLKVSSDYRGVVIEKYSDGSVRKRLIK